MFLSAWRGAYFSTIHYLMLQRLNEKKFRRYLQDALVDRTRKNPNYSMRAFAKSLEVSHAHLSLILRGKRPVTAKFIKKVGASLNLSPQDLSGFLRGASKERIDSIEDSNLQVLQLDQFNLIADWWHDAILELIRLPNFQNDSRWIANRLGISSHQAKDAIERLNRLGLITIDENGYLRGDFLDTSTNINNSVSSPALKSYLKTLNEKSLTALEELPRSVRDHTSTTVAISFKNFEKAKQFLTEFRIRFMEVMQADQSEFDEVYQLNLAFFPLTKKHT